MTPIRIVKGLDVPISGAPEQVITDGALISSVALVRADYAGLRAAMQVEEGDYVKLGQPLFADRKNKRVVFTAPACGRVRAINRGERRSLTSVVITIDGDDEVTFPSWPSVELGALRRDQVVDVLLASGLWTALRTRPFGRRANPDSPPAAIFVTAIDSNPLAARAETIINTFRGDFANGLTAISQLTDGKVYVCQAPRADLPVGVRDNIVSVEFAGPHPSGLVGTHIHFLDPVSANKTVWHLGCQDVIAIGILFTTGRLWVERIVSLAGPPVKRPRLIRTRLGADTTELVSDELDDATCRVISGSVLSGRKAVGPQAYLGRFHNQVSTISEAARRNPQAATGMFSAYSLGDATRPPRRRFPLSTAQNGRRAPILPLGGYERVMPLDVLPTPLVRALVVDDSDMAQALGCLELDEEDLALCAFVCPSKIDHSRLLRRMLDRIEREG